MQNRISVRDARKNISAILSSGKAATIGHRYGELRGFIVGVPAHNSYDRKERAAAMKKARAAFVAAWIEESKQ
jgi:hypothetical protein